MHLVHGKGIHGGINHGIDDHLNIKHEAAQQEQQRVYQQAHLADAHVLTAQDQQEANDIKAAGGGTHAQDDTSGSAADNTADHAGGQPVIGQQAPGWDQGQKHRHKAESDEGFHQETAADLEPGINQDRHVQHIVDDRGNVKADGKAAILYQHGPKQLAQAKQAAAVYAGGDGQKVNRQRIGQHGGNALRSLAAFIEKEFFLFHFPKSIQEAKKGQAHESMSLSFF